MFHLKEKPVKSTLASTVHDDIIDRIPQISLLQVNPLDYTFRHPARHFLAQQPNKVVHSYKKFKADASTTRCERTDRLYTLMNYFSRHRFPLYIL